MESGKKAEDDATNRIIRVRLRETTQYRQRKRGQHKHVNHLRTASNTVGRSSYDPAVSLLNRRRPRDFDIGRREPVILDSCGKSKAPRGGAGLYIKESRSQRLALPALGKQELLVSYVSYQ